MTDTAVTTTEQPSHQAVAAKTRSAPQRVTGKLADAIHRMIDLGERWDDAARNVGLTARAMRKALDKPHVIAHLKQRKQVSREAASAANIKRLCEIRDAADNMPAVQAIRELERLPDDNASGARHLTPGFVVQIVNVQQVADVPKQAVQVIDKA
jgi:hypothetical protein